MLAQITLDSLLDHMVDPNFWLSCLADFFRVIFGLFGWLFSAFVFFGSLFAIHCLLTRPARSAERARLFLDLLEHALQRGQPVEEMILSLAQNRDRTVGVNFYLLAAHIESGLRFGEAIKKVPRFLPPQIAAMLHAGEKLGDLKKVLPACREILRDHPAVVRSAIHYMLLVVLFFSPVFIGITTFTIIFVLPKYRDVFAGMGIPIRQAWPLGAFVFAAAPWFNVIEILLFLMLAVFVLIYIGGPQFTRLFQLRNFPIVDALAWRVPWKQKRLQRTFSAMLAVLLDGGVPETEAVQLAGDCTANEICRRRAQRIVAAIQQGTKLDEAARAFDDSGEFHWRLTNATHARGGFLNALRGWHEALDAKAFQQEEATAHVVTSGIVILNGLLVALIAAGMFGVLVAMLGEMAL